MSESKAQRKLAENEVIFRQYNERIQSLFDEITRISQEDGQEQHVPKQNDEPLEFFCECSNEDCKERISIQPSIYNKIHVERDQFVVIAGHNRETIELVVDKEPGYFIVKKRHAPPTSVESLNKTD